MLLLGGLPAFFAETKFSGDAFRLFRWRAPETRMQSYLETALAREDHAKEVKLFDLGRLFLGRYKGIYEGLYHKDRNLTVRREGWGFTLSLRQHRGALRRVRLGRDRGGARHDHARRDDDVSHVVPPGPGGGDRQPRRDRRHVRRQPVPVDAVRISRAAGGAEHRHRGQRPQSRSRRAVRGRRVPLSGLLAHRGHRHQPADPAGRESSRWSARTARERPRSSNYSRGSTSRRPGA